MQPCTGVMKSEVEGQVAADVKGEPMTSGLAGKPSAVAKADTAAAGGCIPSLPKCRFAMQPMPQVAMWQATRFHVSPVKSNRQQTK